ncbi:gluconeogenesis factor YvcK family protein [Amphibacillus cookii]|uniref:gluconeogenesis factor YvcK family protein n=1 Tax=Amphibacillus cookii TaxID=767787 RepID=UPI00195E3FB7|nr:YvcK family protein [Amphibacillus cookii]MBM7541520.1 putative cofD-like protein [Amphibacillus cookii]
MQVDKKTVAVLGGGTGMPVLLRGLKHYPIHLSAIVTVADDGGSSGRLRTEMAMPAPGDIRNVIAALAEVEPIMEQFFQHRFQNGNGLMGHTMGNLILAAMTAVTGDFYNGIKEIARVFNVKGRIYPIANQNMFLHAEMLDGEIVSGESKIPLAKKRIKRVFIEPEAVEPLPEAVKAVREADLVVISPGSLYTSTLPNLVVPQIADALREAEGKVVYVCNVMTQAGETDDYSAADHAQAIIDHVGEGCIDKILVHNQDITESMRIKYAEENATPVDYDRERLDLLGMEIIEADIIDDHKRLLRHDNNKVAQLLCSLIDITKTEHDKER